MTAASNAERQQAFRDRRRGGPAREFAECGTYAAYARHMRENRKRRDAGQDPLPVDDACRAANAAMRREYRAARSGAAS